MSNKISRIVMTILSLICVIPSSAITAPEVLSKSASKISGAKSVTCTFTLTTQGKSVKGSLKTSGTKFAITTPYSSSWYNGKAMYTYNASSRETTIVTPTAAELAEANPLCYLKGYDKSFTAAFSKTMPKGKYEVILTPKKRNTGIKSVTLIINGKTMLPDAITVTGGGATGKVVLNSVSLGGALPASTFEYPAKNYPKVEIVDLR